MGNTHSGKPRKSLEKPGIPGKPGRFSSLMLATYITIVFTVKYTSSPAIRQSSDTDNHLFTLRNHTQLLETIHSPAHFLGTELNLLWRFLAFKWIIFYE
jgi:hypothetical protein